MHLEHKASLVLKGNSIKFSMSVGFGNKWALPYVHQGSQTEATLAATRAVLF